MDNQQIPKIIVKQLGGKNRLQAMIGAYNFLYSSEDTTWISFKFKGSKKFNYIKITLNAMDLYDIEFRKIWGMKITKTQTINNVYNDQMKHIIEQEIKLYLSL